MLQRRQLSRSPVRSVVEQHALDDANTLEGFPAQLLAKYVARFQPAPSVTEVTTAVNRPGTGSGSGTPTSTSPYPTRGGGDKISI